MENGLNFNGGDRDLRERYRGYRQYLLDLKIRDVDYDVKCHIAFSLHGADMYHSEWEETAFMMGVRNRFIMERIRVSAAQTKEIPLLLALEKYLGNASFVQVVDTLLIKERDDILSDVEAFVKRTVAAFSAFYNPQPEDSNLHEED